MNLKKVTINNLEELSLIKAHTLRTWEKRYGFPKPERSSNNFRYYSVDELERVLKISLLNKSGYKISYLSTLKDFDVDSLINKLTTDEDKKRKSNL